MSSRNKQSRKNSKADSPPESDSYCQADESRGHNSPRHNKVLNQKPSPEYSEDEETPETPKNGGSPPPKVSPASTAALVRSPLHPKKSKYGQVSNKVWVLLVGLIVLLCFILNGYHRLYSNTENEQNGSLSIPSDLLAIKLIKEMKKWFPAQTRHTWTSFYSALENVNQTEPSQPAVLLLIGANTAKYVNTIDCVAKKLAESTNKFLSIKTNSAETSVQIKSLSDFPDKQDEAIKKELDLRIRSILNQSSSIVLRHLEDLPPRAAVLLHGFCDNCEAPFKKTVFILTATFVDKPFDSKQLDRKLENLWMPELGLDITASLISRVANSPIFIEPETGAMPCPSSYPTEL